MDLKMELGGYVHSAPNTKRFVVEDSITKVTSDGEPHGMMTMVAGLSGLLAAIIILAVLVSMVSCRKQKSNNRKSNSSANVVAMTSVAQDQPQLAGNLNAAFAESTLTLDKVKQGTEDQWRPTAVVVERY
ncbi:uncharacterized protein LOC27208310 [Drosophila simulans]|uniref:Uncharacterized protein LOC117147992 n=1 Tax=Drosophila mauritiana TaxID=7226 RepID=A0A6P8KPN9_DROMA|nr:uncharacterized protein LOC27208310 [Drosophila simulans]XP_016039687.1 uncharacterized protein LOC27208310 [Drosophila simulans]XP_033171036.1 uncharacterized protein LOC117147992 [Drosophila mauritiana]XP_033171037.1 uncharacterized protein LOC117147992 [Drosophila mauritiana]XP_033171038.1 uncharacterized protein LOC117147992 [Drosophila mauritiana]XP_039153731.1 uncharacterized protein LOC27208310 [Drosophila simulans]KMZ10199.1 uncharacterized protein Dsimw501_GD28462, isoform A [Dros